MLTGEKGELSTKMYEHSQKTQNNRNFDKEFSTFVQWKVWISGGLSRHNIL